MRSLLRNAVPRSLVLAAFLACSEGASPSIMLALNTNDLVISSDTNLVGLYIAQLDGTGRVLATEAHEAAPLRHPDGRVEVPFPASLLLTDATETRRVHVKLVAFRQDSREPLTMRETRTQLPKERQRLLRLNLFFMNQGNVVDATPGASVLGADAQLTSSDLGFRNATGPIAQAQFDRFTSLCEGAPAAAGFTSGDDGRCVELDVDVESLPLRENTSALVPGAAPGDSCYDIGRAFAPWVDQAVGRIERAALSALPTTGECRIDLPAVYEPTRLNVAMATTETAFENHYDPFDADSGAVPEGSTDSGLSLRPLPSRLAFRQEGNSIVLPEHVCALVRRESVQALLFSQRTVAWEGKEPVCAPWTRAQTPRDFDGPVPLPVSPGDGGLDAESPDVDPGDGGDGGDGGTPASFADYALAPGESRLTSLAAGEGRVAMTLNDSNEANGAVVLGGERFVAPYAEYPRPSAPADDEVSSHYPVVVSMKREGHSEFYLYGMEMPGLWHLADDTQALTRVEGLPSMRFAITPLADGPAITWYDSELMPFGRLTVARLLDTHTVASQPLFQYDLTSNDGSFALESVVGASFGSELLLPDFYARYYVQCTAGQGCVRKPITLPGTAPAYVRHTAHAGDDTFSILQVEGNNGSLIHHHGSDRSYPQPGLSIHQLVGGEGRFCTVSDTNLATGAPSSDIVCFTKAALEGSAPREALATGLQSVLLASDATYLYATYQCGPADATGQDPKTHVARMPWARIGQSPNVFVNRCLVGDPGDAGDGGPTVSPADASDNPQL